MPTDIKEQRMNTLRLGKTELTVSRLAFGALPIQRISLDEAKRILQRAYEGGITFFDTARGYTDSEEKIGAALSHVRKNIVIATKAKADTGEGVTQLLETSLRTLKTDYVDILQIHNPKKIPVPGDGTERYEAMIAAKQAGKIRFLGLSAHALDNALATVSSGLYDTVQFPFSLLADRREMELPAACKAADVGFIAMKALGGGLIRDIPAAFAFTRRFDNVLPIWGIQRMEELEQFLSLHAAPPAWDDRMEQLVEKEKNDLGSNFCRACGYCLPCPEGINIPTVARLMLMLGRGPWKSQVTPEAQANIGKAANCTECGVCKTRCPYELDTPALVRQHWEGYQKFLKEKGIAQ